MKTLRKFLSNVPVTLLLFISFTIFLCFFISSCQPGGRVDGETNREGENPTGNTRSTRTSFGYDFTDNVKQKKQILPDNIPSGYDMDDVSIMESNLDIFPNVIVPEGRADRIIMEKFIRYGRNREFNEMKPMLPDLLTMAGNTPGKLEFVGELAMSLHEYDIARIAFERVLKITPNDIHVVTARILLGRVLIQSGKMKEAIPQLEKANEQLARMQDDRKEFPVIFGMIMEALDKDTELRKTKGMPREELKSALEKAPANPSLHIRAAAVSMNEGDFNTARKEIKTALDLLGKKYK